VPLTIISQGSGGINLCQGRYAQKLNQARRDRSNSHNWRPLAIAAGVVAILGLSMQVFQWASLNQQAENLQAQIEQTYLATFPNETRIVNIRSQMTQKLRQMTGSAGTGTDLMAMLQQLQPALAEFNSIKFELVRYEQGSSADSTGELRVQVRVASFDELEAFRQQVEAAGALSVAQGQTNSEDDYVSGALTITWANDAAATGSVS